MKKLLYGAVALLLTASCAGNKAEKENEESIRQADSIAAIEARQEAQAAAEQARLDSLRQDSIAKAEKASANIPTFNEIMNCSNLAKMFKSHGFKTSVKKVYNEAYETYDEDVTATYSEGNLYCKYITDGYGLEYTIKGNDELLDKFLKDAKAYISREKKKNNISENAKAYKSGSTVTVYFGD